MNFNKTQRRLREFNDKTYAQMLMLKCFIRTISVTLYIHPWHMHPATKFATKYLATGFVLRFVNMDEKVTMREIVTEGPDNCILL